MNAERRGNASSGESNASGRALGSLPEGVEERRLGLTVGQNSMPSQLGAASIRASVIGRMRAGAMAEAP
jgi:hypothetical protein